MNTELDEREVALRLIFDRTSTMIMKACMSIGVDPWEKSTPYDPNKPREITELENKLYREFHAQLEREVEYDTMHTPGAVQSETGKWFTRKWW